MSDLNRKMAKSAAWMILLRFAERAIGVVSTLILARVLVPADFGLVAMAMSVYAAVEIMTMFSFDIALIQNRGAGKEHFDTAWTFNIIFGAGIMILMALAAYPAASFYSDERVASIMLWLGLGAFIRGFENIGVIYFQKDLNLRKEFELGLTRKLVGFAVTVGIAVTYQNYWALVVGTLTQRIFSVGMTYAVHPYRPQLSLAKAAELFDFGKWLAVNNILIFMNHRVPDIFIGRQLGPESLGLFNVSYEISNLPTTELVFPIGRAVFPGYSTLATDPAALRKAYLRVLALIIFLTLPIATGMLLLSGPLVASLLGPKWPNAVPLIEILAIFGFARAVLSNSGAIYIALGSPRLTTYMSLYYLAILGVSLFFCISRWGINGAAYSVLLAALCQAPIALVVTFRMVNAGLHSFTSMLWRPIVATSAMSVAILALQNWEVLQSWPAPLQLLVGVALGAVVYVVTVLIAWTATGRGEGAERDLIQLLIPRRFRTGIFREIYQ